jgi:hypothetical protein
MTGTSTVAVTWNIPIDIFGSWLGHITSSVRWWTSPRSSAS